MAANLTITEELSAALGTNAVVKQLLHVGDDGGITTTLTTIADVDGSEAGLDIATTGIGYDSCLMPTELVTDDKTLVAADSGKTFFIATDAKTFTLPATVAGLKYTFVNTGADGNNIITISPNAADYIAGTITVAASDSDLGVTDDKDLINTKSTAITGDSVTIVGDGVAGWFVTQSTGTWASE